MIPIVSLLVIVVLSLLITRVATAALVHTGLGREAARFQARSAFTGVGFTTSEAEGVVSHPVRRRIVMWLMLVGNVGFVTVISSLVLSFAGAGSGSDWLLRLALLALGLAVLWVLATSRLVNRALSRAIAWGLRRWTQLDARDYATLLHLCGDDYGVAEVSVEPDDWLATAPLGDLGLADEGVLVLGIQRNDGSYEGAPAARTEACPGDTLVLYGRSPRIAELDRRCAGAEGDRAHTQACAAQSTGLGA